VYEVVCVGVTRTDPFAGCAPTPLSIVTPVAFTVDHDNVDDSPALMVAGLAVKDEITGTVGAGPDCRVTEKLKNSPAHRPGTEPLSVFPVTVAVNGSGSSSPVKKTPVIMLPFTWPVSAIVTGGSSMIVQLPSAFF
jgi:hypothetical protein